MRLVLTALVACVFVTMISADTFACPDGCTDEGPLAAPHAISPCGLCHGWSQTPVVVTAPLAPRRLARQVVVTAVPTAPPLPPIERPPQAA